MWLLRGQAADGACERGHQRRLLIPFPDGPRAGARLPWHGMPRPLPALAAAGVAALPCIVITASAASTRHAAAPACTLLVAKSEILASKLPMRVKHDAAG